MFTDHRLQSKVVKPKKTNPELGLLWYLACYHHDHILSQWCLVVWCPGTVVGLVSPPHSPRH